MTAKKTGVQGTNAAAKTRLLLALWDMGGTQQEVMKGQLTKRIIPKGKKVADYKGIFDELQEQGVITVSKKGYTLVSPTGLEVLGEGLKSDDFRFEGTIVGTWAANALLKWISQMSGDVSIKTAPAQDEKSAIASYEEFKPIALAIYDQLNRDYSLNDLVPIYRLRREIGDRTSREHFNKWLLEMQEHDIFQLQGGSLPDSDPAKIEDSITTEISGLRCYAKRLNS